MDGPWGNLASSSPMLAVNRPNRLWPPKALTGMLLGMVQLQAQTTHKTDGVVSSACHSLRGACIQWP
jgi:hypothetical protein